MKRLLAVIALAAGVLGLAPITSVHAASNCTRATAAEFGASNVAKGFATYTATATGATETLEGPNSDLVDVVDNDDQTRSTYSPGTLDVVLDLEGKSCASIDYGIKVYEKTWDGSSGKELYSATVRSAGSFSVRLADGVPMNTNWDCVLVVATTSHDGTVLDRAPDDGTNGVCVGGGGGQGWN